MNQESQTANKGHTQEDRSPAICKVQEVRITTMGVSLVDALWNLCTDFYYYMEIRVLGTTRKRREKNDGKTIQPWKERRRKTWQGPRFIVVRQLPAMVPLIRPQ